MVGDRALSLLSLFRCWIVYQLGRDCASAQSTRFATEPSVRENLAKLRQVNDVVFWGNRSSAFFEVPRQKTAISPGNQEYFVTNSER